MGAFVHGPGDEVSGEGRMGLSWPMEWGLAAPMDTLPSNMRRPQQRRQATATMASYEGRMRCLLDWVAVRSDAYRSREEEPNPLCETCVGVGG